MASGNGEGWNGRTSSNVFNIPAGDQVNDQPEGLQPLYARNQQDQLRANPPHQLTVNVFPAAANQGYYNGRRPLQGRSDQEGGLRNAAGFLHGNGGYAPEQRAGVFNTSSRMNGQNFPWERTNGHAYRPFPATGRSRVAPQAAGNGNGNGNGDFMSIPNIDLVPSSSRRYLLGANFHRGESSTSNRLSLGGDVPQPLVIRNSRGSLGRLPPRQPNPASIVRPPLGLRSAEVQAFASTSLQPFPNASASAPQLPSQAADTRIFGVSVMNFLPSDANADGTPARLNPVLPPRANLELQNGSFVAVGEERELPAMFPHVRDIDGRVLREQQQMPATNNRLHIPVNGPIASNIFAPPPRRQSPNIDLINAFTRAVLMLCPHCNDPTRNTLTRQEVDTMREFIEAHILEMVRDDEDGSSRRPGLEEETIAENIVRDAHGSATAPAMDDSCSICLEEYVNGVEVAQLNCGHGFHYRCIGTWLRVVNVCPICRRAGVELDDEEDFDDDDDRE